MVERTPFAKRILVGVDGSPTARRALKTAVQIARGLDGELLIVSAYEPTPEAELKTQRLLAPPDVSHLLHPTAAVEQILEDARRVAGADGLTAECFARVGAPADVVVDLAAERDASLIVVGNRGMRGNQLFRSCVPNAVSHRAPCSVLIVDTISAVATETAM
jgi:nucleotide-binding universal stress UspA family protein